ncbi:MAG: DUF58 domain-containing protein [Magnetococcales bacterium]|nr:DUF58 domain-containing protein [Magnetococcales bacterium]
MRRIVLPGYRRFTGMEWRARRRFTPLGKILMTGLLLAAVFGVDTNQTYVYRFFSLLLAMILVAGVWSLFFRRTFRMHRSLPRFCTAGEPFDYTLRITNPGEAIRNRVTVLDELEDPRPDFATFMRTREPGEAQRNLFDRMMRFHRYQWLIRRNAGLEPVERTLDGIPANTTIRQVITAKPLRRGRIRFSKITLAKPDPFGLYRALISQPAPETLLVLPRRYALPPNLRLDGGRRYHSGGVSMASMVGDAEEFVSLREYREGDPPKRLHWPSWAKTGKPVVKEYQEEYFVRQALILDTLFQGNPLVFEEAVAVAASFAISVESGDSLLDLLFVGPGEHRYTYGRGVAHAEQMLELLAEVQPTAEHEFDDLEGLVSRHLTTMSGCIFVMMGWDRKRRELVEKVRVHGIPATVFVVLSESVDSDALPEPGPMADRPDRFRVLHPGRVEEGLLGL